ncbi:hypothetical protein E4U52_006719 [Claviceps spartinae]|nr:hypothetical protein E4U52_006719 [Claviceps spartinae]
MADWCDLALGNPLDEQPDFDGEPTESARSQAPPSASQSARSLKSREFIETSRICGQWTSGLVSGLASGLAILVVGQRRVFGRKWTSFEKGAPESTSEAGSRRSSFSHES